MADESPVQELVDEFIEDVLNFWRESRDEAGDPDLVIVLFDEDHQIQLRSAERRELIEKFEAQGGPLTSVADTLRQGAAVDVPGLDSFWLIVIAQDQATCVPIARALSKGGSA